jgi:hypothetical protein
MANVEAVLLALRKSSTVPADATGEVGVDEAKALFNVEQIGDFRALISAFGAQLNQQVRNAAAFKAELAVDAATERQYFGVPPVPDNLKPLLDAAGKLIDESLVDANSQAAIAEAEGEDQLAQELLAAAGPGTAMPKHLATQIEDAAMRTEQVLSKLTTSAVLKRAAAVATQAEKRIKALRDYKLGGLHDAHRGDIKKAVTGLKKKADEAKAIGDEIKAQILTASRRLAEMKKRLA